MIAYYVSEAILKTTRYTLHISIHKKLKEKSLKFC